MTGFILLATSSKVIPIDCLRKHGIDLHLNSFHDTLRKMSYIIFTYLNIALEALILLFMVHIVATVNKKVNISNQTKY